MTKHALSQKQIKTEREIFFAQRRFDQEAAAILDGLIRVPIIGSRKEAHQKKKTPMQHYRSKQRMNRIKYVRGVEI